MNEMTIGQLFATSGCALVSTVLLIVGIVLLVDSLERAKCWMKKRRMKTYKLQYIVSKIAKDGKVIFFEDSIETKYLKARCPSAAVKKLFDLDGCFSTAIIGEICIRKVVEIQSV